MRSMISGSMAAPRSVVMPSLRTAVSRVCSVAPTEGKGSSMMAPCRPEAGRLMRTPSGRLSTTAPNLRSVSRWKSMGRPPMAQPPSSGMNASPSWWSRGPQKRIGMREAPASVSMSEREAILTFVGSSIIVPRSWSKSAVTPCRPSRSETTSTSRIRGTL